MIKITTFPYLGDLPQVGSECGTWLESRWPADQVKMGLAFFSPSICIGPVSQDIYVVQRFSTLGS